MIHSLAAIQRGHQYSPNHIENDTLILYKTIEELEKLGYKIKVYQEDSIVDENLKERMLFHMIRGSHALDSLRRLTKKGELVINSVEAVYNCYRKNMAKLLPEGGVPTPKTIVVLTNPKEFNASLADELGEKVWVKRGDVHAIHREDVTLVYSKAERDNVLREYYRRGIDSAVVQQHIPGDVVKFYGVRGTDFFHWYYLEKNGGPKFDVSRLTEIAKNSADTLHVDIYGGDAIIDDNGNIYVIDLNDWPSFAPIRDVACTYIAKIIDQKAKEYNQRMHTNE